MPGPGVMLSNIKHQKEEKIIFLCRMCKSFHLQKLLEQNIIWSGLCYLLNLPNSF